MTSLLLTAALFCGQFDQELAIAIAINAPVPAEQSVVAENVPAVPKLAKLPTRLGGRRQVAAVRYPTTPRQNPWLQGGRHIHWSHLTTGQHRGKFSAAWLKTLSRAELEQLHADDHEHKVKWAYVVRP